MKKIQSKMKALECLQDFPHYKSMGTFSNAQGQLTLQSQVKSDPNSNSSEILWLSSLPARMKKTRSTVSGEIRPKFELIQAVIVVLVTCKNEEHLIKNEIARVLTTFLPLNVYGNFFRRSRAANSAVLGRIWSNSSEILWLSSLPASTKKIRSKLKALEY